MIGWRELLIILVIVLLVFGTKRLKNIGSDLGEAVKGFKKGMSDADDNKPHSDAPDKPDASLRDDSRKD